MWIESSGYLKRDLKQFTNDRPYWTILSVDRTIGDFYRHQIETEGIGISFPLAGDHISLIKEEYVKPANIPNKLKFEYCNQVETNGKHWWLPVRGIQLEQFRLSLGLSAAPYYPFHLTVAVAAEPETIRGRAPKEVNTRLKQLINMKKWFSEYLWGQLKEADELIRIQQLYTF